jgi:hypothetical protein
MDIPAMLKTDGKRTLKEADIDTDRYWDADLKRKKGADIAPVSKPKPAAAKRRRLIDESDDESSEFSPDDDSDY